MKLAVLASGAGTNLQALLDHVHGQDGTEIVAVASDKSEAVALTRARSASIETGVFATSEFEGDRVRRDAALVSWLEGRKVELIVLAGYMQILSPAFLAAYPARVINVHPALLPAFPGLRAIDQALAYGAKITGVTVHFVDEGVDTGPIIAQAAIHLKGDESMAEVLDRLHPLEHELLCAAVRLFATGGLKFDPGNPRRVIVSGPESDLRPFRIQGISR